MDITDEMLMYNDVLNTLVLETGKPLTRIVRLMTVAPNQGVIRRFWEIFDEKYPDADMHSPHCPDCGGEMSLVDEGIEKGICIEHS